MDISKMVVGDGDVETPVINMGIEPKLFDLLLMKRLEAQYKGQSTVTVFWVKRDYPQLIDDRQSVKMRFQLDDGLVTKVGLTDSSDIILSARLTEFAERRAHLPSWLRAIADWHWLRN